MIVDVYLSVQKLQTYFVPRNRELIRRDIAEKTFHMAVDLEVFGESTSRLENPEFAAEVGAHR
jgi:hypothetical protein